MTAQVKLNVTFQSKVSDGLECTPEKILLHAADVKALKVKVGGVVRVEMPNSVCFCRAWPSKKAVVGSATLNKLWVPNFPVDIKKIRVSLVPQARPIPCASITFVIIGKPQYEEVLATSSFQDLLKAMITNTPMRTGLMLGFTQRCQYHIIKVESCTAEDQSAGEPPEQETLYMVNTNTKIQVETHGGKRSSSSESLLDATQQASMTGKQKMDLFSAKMRSQFAGYTREVAEAIGTACLGLGGKYQLSECGGSKGLGKGLARPPKGMILYGPPGTGKSSLMRGLVSALGCEHVELSHSVLLSRYEGEAERAVTRVFQEAADKAPCCVLIDNMDLLCYSRTAAGASELQKRVVACLLTLMDGLGGGDGPASGAAPGKGGAMQGVFVIGTTTRVGDIDSAVRRAGRIDKELEIGVPSSPDREAILLHLLQRAGVSVDCTESQPQVISEQASVPINNKEGLPLAIVHDVAKLAHGMVGSDLLLVVKEAFYLTLRDKDDNLSDESLMLKPQATVTPNKKPEASTTTADSIDLAIGSLASEFEDLDITDEVEAEAEAGVGEQSCPTPPPTLALSVINPGKCCSNPTGNHSETTACNRRGLITESALRRAVSKISPSALREVMIEVPSVRWTDIGGMEGVKQSLREVVEWPLLHPELFATLGISPPKGVLLYGPPGCSKTLMAKALATESSMNFLAVRGPELLSKWLGESEKAVQALFRRARAAAPSIVFFDEIDALAGKRGDVSSGVSDRVLSQLLTELDGVHGLKQVIVIAATNRPDMLDAALVRPGRIDRKIYVPPPDECSREQILQLELKKMPLEGKFDFSELVALTAGFSGAEIVGACSEAAMLAIEEDCTYLHSRHLVTAVHSVKPQITETMLQFYKSCAANL